MGITEKLATLFGNRPDTDPKNMQMGNAWWEDFTVGDVGGGKKAVYTEAFWLAPPYGRPRDIDYGRLEALERSVWVRMCIQHIINGVAKARWNISPDEEGDDVPESEIKEVEDFFKSRKWSDSFREVLRITLPDMLHYDAGVILKAYESKAYDEQWNLKDGGKGYKPVELYARDGRSFMKDTDLTGNLWGYWQYSWFNPQGKPTWFSPNEVLYLQLNPQSRSPYGISNLEIIEREVTYLKDSTEAQTKYWKNGLFVGGVIRMPEVKDINEIKRYQKYYESKLKGAENYNKWIVAGGDADFQTQPFTPQQMQWLDSQKWFAKLVFSVFRVTPSELGFTEDLNRATGAQQMQIYKSEAIMPILELLEEIINREIVWKDFSERVKFTFEKEFDLDDSRKQAEIDSIRLNMGLNSINELRDRDGLQKWDDEQYDLPMHHQEEQEGGEEEQGFPPLNLGSKDQKQGHEMPESSTEPETDLDDEGEGDATKAARAGALSGQEGYTPIPESYDGLRKPPKTKRNEKAIQREVDLLWKALSDQAKEEIKRYYNARTGTNSE